MPRKKPGKKKNVRHTQTKSTKEVYILPRTKSSAQMEPPADDPAFRLWFDERIGSSFSKSFSMIPDVEVLTSLHALLIRAGFRPEMTQEDDETALLAYLRLVRAHGDAKASGVAYRIAICATVADLRERHKLASSPMKLPPTTSHEPPPE